jgi:hypothetical protein
VKRLVTRLVATFAAVSFGLVAFATVVSTQALAQPANFGSPPSGEVPILYNDQHVYAKPDTLKHNRVLAAIVRGSTIFVPLRSMFEQMGATVSYDPSTKTVTVSKSGANVQVTLGRPEVVINGESRPLDVPPEMYHGVIVVPVRVISEGMGAYVQWVPDKRVVVVRYIPAPVPTLPPPPPPTPAPTARPPPPPPPPPPPTPPPPTPAPAPPSNTMFWVAGDYIFSPKVYNEFSPGNSGTSSYAFRGGFTTSLGSLPILAEAEYRSWQYPHNQPVAGSCSGAAFGTQGCVTSIGGKGQTNVPAFAMRDTDVDARLGIGIGIPKVYIVGSYLSKWGNYGYPQMTGFGGGLELVPSLKSVVGLEGSAIYYPSVTGNFTDPFGNRFNLQYRVLRYMAGVTFAIPSTPIFLEGGLLGDHGTAGTNAPSNYAHSGLFAGLGIHF